MKSTPFRLWLAAGLCVLALGGCGGGGGGNDGVALGAPDTTPAPLDAGAAVVQYLLSLIAGTNETDEPIDLSAVTLALDDAADAAGL